MKINNAHIFICAWIPYAVLLNLNTFVIAMVITVAIIGDYIRKDVGKFK